VIPLCGEYRLQLAVDHQCSDALNIPVTVYKDDRSISTPEEFALWADDSKQLRMEYFYREMRSKTGLLMKGEKPAGAMEFRSGKPQRL